MTSSGGSLLCNNKTDRQETRSERLWVDLQNKIDMSIINSFKLSLKIINNTTNKSIARVRAFARFPYLPCSWQEIGEGKLSCGQNQITETFLVRKSNLDIKFHMTIIKSNFYGPSTCLFLSFVNQINFTCHYIILNNGIPKSNSSIFPRSKGYITQYTP